MAHCRATSVRSLSYPCAEILGGIQCPHRFASLGNHDALVGWAVVVDALKVHGIPTLLNSSLPFERDGSRLWFAGTRSSDGGLPQPGRCHAAPPRPTSRSSCWPMNRIMPATSWPTAAWISCSPATPTAARCVCPSSELRDTCCRPEAGASCEGYFKLGPLQLYVNRGIGTVKLPVRFLCPPELTLITLQPAES